MEIRERNKEESKGLYRGKEVRSRCDYGGGGDKIKNKDTNMEETEIRRDGTEEELNKEIKNKGKT